LTRGEDAPEAVALLRKTLAAQPDSSVVIVQVGFFTNLARLLEAGPDAHSPVGGEELVRRKVKFLALMAGGFQTIDGGNRYAEYNVIKDLGAARTVTERWPTPRVWSGFEIGLAATYPHHSIERDYGYVAHHPLQEAYHLYAPPPHDRPTWDPTAVLYAVLPDHGYFRLSPPGKVTVEADGATAFRTAENGRDRYLILEPMGIGRVREAVVQLSSQPPG
jgi:inosine-uridine nucleoside N-ribohydrolase